MYCNSETTLQISMGVQFTKVTIFHFHFKFPSEKKAEKYDGLSVCMNNAPQ